MGRTQSRGVNQQRVKRKNTPFKQLWQDEILLQTVRCDKQKLPISLGYSENVDNGIKKEEIVKIIQEILICQNTRSYEASD